MLSNIINKTTIVALLTILLGSSCSDFLDVAPTSELESNYFENENRIQRGIGAIYAEITNLYGSNLAKAGATHPMCLLQGDDLAANGTSYSNYEAFSGFSAGDGLVAQYWGHLYQTISRANFMLQKIELPEILAVYTTPNLSDYNKGEALFLKSWAYYRLWDMFRKAPLQEERIESMDAAILPPSKGFEMLDCAIKHLEAAAELLPPSWSQENKGRVFKNSAYGLLVKCYVMRACYATEYGGNKEEDYNKAISFFEKMTPDNTIANVPFGDNFDYRTENNAESLFEFQASHAQKEDNSWLDNNYGGDAGFMGAYYQYFTTHWAAGAPPIGPTRKLMKLFEPGDPRQLETFKKAEEVDNCNGSLWWLGSAWDYYDGYQFVKYINGERGNLYDRNWQITSGNNPRILRLADVFLTVAEAYFQTGNVAKATGLVNQVRTRARFSTPDGSESAVPANYSTVTFQNIMDERMLELAGEEGIRWTDLRRWHAAGYIDLSQWTSEDFGYLSDSATFAFSVPKHLLYPIPTGEINSNPLMQADGNNPGYN